MLESWQLMSNNGSNGVEARREQDKVEAVDHPAHYGGADNPYEAIKVIEAWDLKFSPGAAVKYIARHGKKPGASAVKDLRKAAWYCEREAARIEQDLKGEK